MTLLKAALLVTSVAGETFAQRFVPRETAYISLLQGRIEEKSSKQRLPRVLEDDLGTKEEYNLPDSLNCKSQDVATLVEPPSPVSMLEQHVSRQAESVDPPGSHILRATLGLMTLALIFDGVRRLRAQKQDCEQDCTTEKLETFPFRPPVASADIWGCTALHLAAAEGSMATIAELLKEGVEVDPVDVNEETPLHFAARAGHAPICELLLGAGAKIDAVNVQERTPLVVAGHSNQEAVCRLLTDSGAGVAGLTDEELPLLVVSQLVRKVFEA